ncbi:uncharacterized protein [Panulirus ornatus]|uniref:uncharacterized protein isoform X2 n=1 Tax=Panulirus ornatus TaxID=150431 RepID=UPI003A8AC176
MALLKPTSYFWLCGVVVIGQVMYCQATMPRPKCFMQSVHGIMRSGDICSFGYDTSKGCDVRGYDSQLGYRNRSKEVSGLAMNTRRDFLSIRNCHLLDTANSILDLFFTLHNSRRVMLMVSGLTSRGRRRCVTIDYQDRPGWEERTLIVKTLPLPHGNYSATLFIFDGMHPLTSPDNFTVVAHQTFFVHHTGCYRWDKVKRRSKRVGDIGLELQAYASKKESTTPEENCENCYDINHTYRNDSALLKFTFHLKNSSGNSCPNECNNVRLWLYKQTDIHNKTNCIPNMTADFGDLFPTKGPRNGSQGHMSYSNLDFGCYMLAVEKPVHKSLQFSDFIWVDPSNRVDLKSWNTTFYLDPNNKNRSLLVTWRSNDKYRFSEFELHLWHNSNHSISCRGDNTTYGRITRIPPNGKLIIQSTKYIFFNLSSGWYCARVTPIDERCDSDSCPSLFSHAVRLNDPVVKNDPPPLNIIPIVIGLAVAVLLAGIVCACCVLQMCPLCEGFKGPYSLVSGSPGAELKESQVVLLVWTPYGPHGADFVPIIRAFKKILQSYCNCEVYDYLDLLSLPEEQRHHLLETPIAWIDTLLAKSNVKIVIIATDGAKLRQDEGMGPFSQNHTDEAEDRNPHDSLLFPYLLRCLQNKYDLASDYSRIFHVRFSDVSGSSTELQGIVSWTRFRLPEHLKNLTLSIHGKPESCSIDEPPTETLRDLRAALMAHPMYGRFSSVNTPNSNQKSNGTGDLSQVQSNILASNYSQWHRQLNAQTRQDHLILFPVGWGGARKE